MSGAARSASSPARGVDGSAGGGRRARPRNRTTAAATFEQDDDDDDGLDIVWELSGFIKDVKQGVCGVVW